MIPSDDSFNLEDFRIPPELLPKVEDISTRRLVWDSIKQKLVPPAECSVAHKGFEFMVLPPEQVAQLAVELKSPVLAVLFRLYRNWFSQYRKNPLPLASFELKGLKISRMQKSRALQVLQKVGLISVEKRRGKTSVVTLLWFARKP
jgi:hypothetical protein